MWKLLLGFILVALVLLIMRISQLNDKIASMDEQLSDFVTNDYLLDIMDIMQLKQGSLKDIEQMITEMKQNLNKIK